MSYGFAPASTVLEIGIFKFIYAQLKNNDLRIICDLARFADNLTGYANCIDQLGQRCEELEEAFCKYSLFFKRGTEPH